MTPDQLLAAARRALAATGALPPAPPQTPPPTTTTTATATPDVPATDLEAVLTDLMVTGTVRRMLEHTADRSKAHQAFVRACLEAGYSEPAIVRLARHHRPSVDKYGTGARLVDEVRRSIGKAREHILAGESVDGETSPWQPVDLMPAWHGEREIAPAAVLRRTDGTAVYPPGINYLFGDSGDGKSFVALIAVLEVLREGGHAVWISYEDPSEYELVNRLRLLGATVDELERLAVIVATEPLTEGVLALAALVRRHRTAVMVLDSVGEALAVAGIDEDKDSQFGPWARQTLRRLIDLAAADDWEHDRSAPNEHLAVIPIDHSTKAKENPHYPSGSKRKRAFITGVMGMMNVRESFGIGRVGRVQLIASKDRTGRFRRGEVMAEIVIDATTTPYSVTVEAPPAGSAMTATGRRRRAEDRVLQVLELAAGNPLDAAEVQRQVNSDRVKLPGEGDLSLGTVQNALSRLHQRPGVTREMVPTGVAKAHRALYSASVHESDTGRAA